MSRMRAAIARTVTESWQTIPHFSVTVDVTMDAAEEIRRELKSSGTALSVNDFILKAAALALRKYPRANSSFSNDRIITHDAVNIGIAVSLPDGLLVPVIRGCDTLPLQGIAAESRRLVDAARNGRLNQSEMTGGTFTVSNLGMYGITSFSAVILPPQSAILAVGAVREVVVPRKGMPFTSTDHDAYPVRRPPVAGRGLCSRIPESDQDTPGNAGASAGVTDTNAYACLVEAREMPRK